MSRTMTIKDGPSALRAVKAVVAADDCTGGEAPAGWTQRRLGPTQVAVFAPPGTKRATLVRLLGRLPGGHVDTAPVTRRKNATKRLCLVWDVVQAPAAKPVAAAKPPNRGRRAGWKLLPDDA